MAAMAMIERTHADPTTPDSFKQQPSAFGETLGAFIAEKGRRFGDAPALTIKPGFRTRVTTYRELDVLARRIARELHRRGVRPGDRVLLWAPNSPEWVAAFFGCHKA